MKTSRTCFFEEQKHCHLNKAAEVQILHCAVVLSHLSSFTGQLSRLFFRLPPSVARERQAGRARHQSRRAARWAAAALTGDGGFCKGRLAQEDVKELEE